VTLDDPLANPPGVAKYKQIYLLLRQSIEDGTYSAGTRLPSENELVKRLSASRPTIGRAFAQLESEGLIQRRAGSGTFVSSQTAMANLSFGLLIPDLGATEIFETICQGISQGRNGSHHDLIWGPLFDGDASKVIQAERLSEHFLSRKPAGVFFAPLESTEGKDEANLRIAKNFEDAGIPLVLLDRDIVEYPKRSRYDVVGIDNHRAGMVMTEHLLDAGAQRIVFFARPYSAPTVKLRIMGYRSAAEARGLDRSAQRICFADPTELSAVEELMRENRPDAILCANDVTAVHLMTTLMRMGVRIPGDVRVTGMDDLKYASLLQVPLTSIRQPGLAIGATAMLAMRDRVANPQMPARDLHVDFELKVRDSSRREL
jgi:DNA-binding LacI/PurR family transcriptional regulator